MSYTHTVAVPLSWEDAVQRTREALGEQGFGILTEIVTAWTLKKLAWRYECLTAEITEADSALKEILDTYAPLLCDLPGVGP